MALAAALMLMLFGRPDDEAAKVAMHQEAPAGSAPAGKVQSAPRGADDLAIAPAPDAAMSPLPESQIAAARDAPAEAAFGAESSGSAAESADLFAGNARRPAGAAAETESLRAMKRDADRDSSETAGDEPDQDGRNRLARREMRSQALGRAAADPAAAPSAASALEVGNGAALDGLAARRRAQLGQAEDVAASDMLVVEVAITADAVREGAFDKVLAEQHIVWQAPPGVRKELQSLDESAVESDRLSEVAKDKAAEKAPATKALVKKAPAKESPTEEAAEKKFADANSAHDEESLDLRIKQPLADSRHAGEAIALAPVVLEASAAQVHETLGALAAQSDRFVLKIAGNAAADGSPLEVAGVAVPDDAKRADDSQRANRAGQPARTLGEPKPSAPGVATTPAPASAPAPANKPAQENKPNEVPSDAPAAPPLATARGTSDYAAKKAKADAPTSGKADAIAGKPDEKLGDVAQRKIEAKSEAQAATGTLRNVEGGEVGGKSQEGKAYGARPNAGLAGGRKGSGVVAGAGGQSGQARQGEAAELQAARARGEQSVSGRAWYYEPSQPDATASGKLAAAAPASGEKQRADAANERLKREVAKTRAADSEESRKGEASAAVAAPLAENSEQAQADTMRVLFLFRIVPSEPSAAKPSPATEAPAAEKPKQ
jgi:hypothetical protein